MNQNIQYDLNECSALGSTDTLEDGVLHFAPYRSTLTMLLSAVFWTLAGTAVFFALFAVLAPEKDPFETLIASSFAGVCGVLVSSLWISRFKGYRFFLILIITAYILRVLVGVFLYLDVKDKNYFQGNGRYPVLAKDNEFYWTYDYVTIAADILSHRNISRTKAHDIKKEDKNVYIHVWMGAFMAAGDSRHALDLAPFNAFHHAVAGILVIALALACGYPHRVSLWSGALIAWIPWGFPASMMWRDSVGFLWVVLAVVLLCIGRELGVMGSLSFAIPASFLAWSNRSPYFMAIVLITVLSILYDQRKSSEQSTSKLPRLILLLTFLLIGLFVFKNQISLLAFSKHQGQVSSGSMSSRLLMSPLLLLRALAGPFPWFVGSKYDTAVLFDYIFHVFQFAVFLIYVAKWRIIKSRITLLTYAAAIFWVFGFIAGGVHTSYLAVSAPFVLPPVLDTGASFWKYLLVSVLCFVIGNVAYISLGLVGSGYVLGTTGY